RRRHAEPQPDSDGAVAVGVRRHVHVHARVGHAGARDGRRNCRPVRIRPRAAGNGAARHRPDGRLVRTLDGEHADARRAADPADPPDSGRGERPVTIMYETYYGFAEKPFSLTPDPKYLYRSESHGNAFDLLQYAIRRREGFVVVSGDIGTGKTTLCRALL